MKKRLGAECREAVCREAVCRVAECREAECREAECRVLSSGTPTFAASSVLTLLLILNKGQ